LLQKAFNRGLAAFKKVICRGADRHSDFRLSVFFGANGKKCHNHQEYSKFIDKSIGSLYNEFAVSR
jgi:hypothetical protein